MNVYEEIGKLKAKAAEQGIEVRFRDRKMPSGDFCIFIYDRNFRAHTYTVGYDGSWDGNCCTFESCLKQAYKWLEKRDNRYEKINGKWIPKQKVA